MLRVLYLQLQAHVCYTPSLTNPQSTRARKLGWTSRYYHYRYHYHYHYY